MWIVPKKADNSGKAKWRVVIDYRKLNEVTHEDKFAIPNMNGIFDKLGRAQYFTTLDLAKGFHLILVDEKDKHKTAFSTEFGHYEYVRMPFGLKNAPATFQRMMNHVERQFINKICVVYLDDILIFTTSIEEHVDSLNNILEKVREHNLKIQIDKYSFFQKETDYLGHIITNEVLNPNPKKIEIIKKIPVPKTTKERKSFLGITGYYRKFIKDYSKVSYPIVKYLKKDIKININDQKYVNAFEKLKELLIDYPILTTDASAFAIGAVLAQEGHPICYASSAIVRKTTQQ